MRGQLEYHRGLEAFDDANAFVTITSASGAFRDKPGVKAIQIDCVMSLYVRLACQLLATDHLEAAFIIRS